MIYMVFGGYIKSPELLGLQGRAGGARYHPAGGLITIVHADFWRLVLLRVSLFFQLLAGDSRS